MMKKLNLIFLLASLILFSGFSKKPARISMDNLSVEIPDDFVIQRDSIHNMKLIFADAGTDKFFISKVNELDFNTMGESEKKEIIIKNLNGFVKGIHGEHLKYEAINIRDVQTQSTFTFDLTEPESMVAYGKIVLQESTLIFLTYITKVQADEASLKTKEDIFNSLKIN